MRTRNRRGIEEFSMSFLDVISCGFGAIILLLIITKTVEPILLEKSVINYEGQVASRELALFEIKGQINELRRQVTMAEGQLDDNLLALARLEQELTRILGAFLATTEKHDDNAIQTQKLAVAKQSLTDEMQRLLGSDFRRQTDLVGGIAVDSEWIIFVIDTSGSMVNGAWPQVLRKVQETLAIYPTVKGIQVMNDMGEYMFSSFAGRWIPDTPARRRAIIDTLRTWHPFSNSSPVEGIQAAINTFYAPDKRIGIYVFGDDYSGNSIEEVVDAIDRVNIADETGRRRVRINAIGFPVHLMRPNARVYRFAALMRELAYRNDGTFVGLSEFQ
ncbi:MAG: VWA domain-containing protein [Gammaproteobacteria bacterium]|nr:VWA domain-containing protein [Gammaproteobacteria bacterium]